MTEVKQCSCGLIEPHSYKQHQTALALKRLAERIRNAQAVKKAVWE